MTAITPDPGTASYAPGHQPSVLASHAARTAANSCAYFADRVPRGARVLDLGCGPGSITLDLAEMVGPEGQVVGVDFSPAAIDAARRAAHARGDSRTRFVVADLDELGGEPETFDVVYAQQVLQHLGDPVAALRTMGRLCRSGGIVAVRDADYGAMAWFPEFAGLRAWHELYCASARALGGEPDAGRRLNAWVRAAGLVVDAATSSVWTYATPDTARWWGGSQADRVETSSFADHARARGVASEQLAAIAADWRAWGEDPDAWFLLPHGEVVARRP
ncbi:methyltransferase domain-containing protein [Propioniciclava sp.]|uniref:methyltransferase domain-containing protein n=1 Tax=Propioniciclava sp. TaxID=2038686 RepID=UPI00260F4025|nr:methyltransferase domain-containing protein [Propioniciclava sp.]